MKHKFIVLDRTFLFLIWPDVLICISQAILILVMGLGIWWLSGSFGNFVSMLQSIRGSIIRVSVPIALFLNCIMLLINTGVIFGAPGWLKHYLVSIPIEPVSSFSAIREMNSGDDFMYKLFTGGVLAMIAFSFLALYFLQGDTWYSALGSSLLGVLPFPVAFLVTFSVHILVQLILLVLRYVIQRNRY